MKELIEALQILLKYGNPTHPFHCEHDVLYICGYDLKQISKEDTEKLKELRFLIDEEEDQMYSYRYGSA